ncbi:MAG: ethanolamine ammonia-lyase subunit EutB [Calditrichaceae bacterium]
MKLSAQVFGTTYQFRDVKDVLAKANEHRSGDVLAGVAAASSQERVAAKYVLSNLTLADLRNNPVVSYEKDAVTRIIQDAVNERIYESIKNWSVSELREFILSNETTLEDIQRLRKGLTSEIVAAVAKIMTNLDLMIGAKKMPVIAKANSTIGLPGTFGCRLQPNDTRDDVKSITAQIYEGLSYGAGDILIGINPVIDTPENIHKLLDLTNDIMEKWSIPTQNCILGHVSNQVEAIKKGAPAGCIFQSLAGSEKGLKEFGVTVQMLDEAYAVGKEYCRIAGSNMMYFETGQGSELSANAHYNSDQVTMEARCYGLAKHFNPFMVNTVVGFIGPEYLYDSRQITRAGLEDHFMGKLTGVSMGADACYTNHANADQNSMDNLMGVLASAGINYVMGVAAADDIMLNYQSTSFHDTAAVRQLMGYKPSPEFEKWLEKMGIWENGNLTPKAGDPSIFF